MPMERLACFGKRGTARRAVDEAHASSVSSAAMQRLSFDGKPSARAAAVQEPKSTTLAKI